MCDLGLTSRRLDKLIYSAFLPYKSRYAVNVNLLQMSSKILFRNKLSYDLIAAFSAKDLASIF